MKIAVMGSGGLGGYFGGLLAHAGADVTFIARGEHLRALRERGLRLTTTHGDYTIPVRATDDPASIGAVDLVLFCVKSQDTETAARASAPLVRETKDENWKTDLRPDERRKIHCGERHFTGALGVDYKVVSKASELP